MPAPKTRKHVVKKVLEMANYPLTAVTDKNRGLQARWNSSKSQLSVWMHGSFRTVHEKNGVMYFYA